MVSRRAAANHSARPAGGVASGVGSAEFLIGGDDAGFHIMRLRSRDEKQQQGNGEDSDFQGRFLNLY